MLQATQKKIANLRNLFWLPKKQEEPCFVLITDTDNTPAILMTFSSAIANTLPKIIRNHPKLQEANDCFQLKIDPEKTNTVITLLEDAKLFDSAESLRNLCKTQTTIEPKK